MRHFSYICNDTVTCNIPSERNGELAFGTIKFHRIDDFTHGNYVGLLVRHLDAHAGGGKIQGEIVRKTGDPADFDACRWLQFISRDRRTTADIQNTHLHAKAFERLYKKLSVSVLLSAYVHVSGSARRTQKPNRRLNICIAGILLREKARLFLFRRIRLFAGKRLLHQRFRLTALRRICIVQG